MLKIKFLFIFLLAGTLLSAQPDRWQQRMECTMNIDFEVRKHQFSGTQKLVYHNNSPEVLNKVFYHLYFNAFQPGSMMDMQNRTLPDADSKIKGKIEILPEAEIGFLTITSLKQDGKDTRFEHVGTILEVTLEKPIAPNSSVTFDMEFVGQVPVQIRRSGRDNKEGIDYSMSQWYPKMCEYDYQGWHANPYIGREFYGVWGDFDVTINIDKNWVVGATGYLQDKEKIGHGYAKQTSQPKGDKLSWRFLAPNVHDFVWAADPDYKHVIKQAANGPEMHFIYIETENNKESWDRLPDVMEKVFEFASKNYGKYPYDVYSFIQGGDGGMEYPMATLITGERSFPSLVGVSVHELMHSWYQMILGSNEALYAWMDEGFTSHVSAEIMNYLKQRKLLGNMTPVSNPLAGSIASYGGFTNTGYEEPLSTHADHFKTNSAYGVGSYVKGDVMLTQLEYIMGKVTYQRAMLRYFDTWKFKHPNPNDFIRIMEKESGLELDWYKEHWVNTTNTIDYGIKTVEADGRKEVKITLEKIGVMPMPVDVVVTDKKGDKTTYTIPLRIMRGEKTSDTGEEIKVAKDWPWTNPTYELVIPMKFKKIRKVEIDPSIRMADVKRGDNTWEKK
jgi:hypothetical protein